MYFVLGVDYLFSMTTFKMITHCVFNLFCWPLVALGVTVAIGKVKEDLDVLAWQSIPTLHAPEKQEQVACFKCLKK